MTVRFSCGVKTEGGCRAGDAAKGRARTDALNVASISHGDVHRSTLVDSEVLHHPLTWNQHPTEIHQDCL